MIEQDTIRLLRECDSGAKMGVQSLNDVMDYAQSKEMKNTLLEAKTTHQDLSRDIRQHLDRFHDEGKAPSPMASGMSWLKTHAELAMKPSDQTIADLMTDGCNMGVKSLSKYLNQYQAADEKSKSLAARLIHAEEKLSHDMRPFL